MWCTAFLAAGLFFLAAGLFLGPVLATEISFEILQDKDAPGNDFKRLNGVTVETCEARCAEESRCAAFTYNQRRRVCFLKDRRDPELSDYRGAITGLRQAVQAPAPPDADAPAQAAGVEGKTAAPQPDLSAVPAEPLTPAVPPGPEIATARVGEGCTLFDSDFALTRNPNIVLRFARVGDGADENDRARMVFTDQGTEVLSGSLRLRDDRFEFIEVQNGSAGRGVTILDAVNPSGNAVRDPVFVVVGGLPFEGGVFRRTECRAP